MINITKKDTSEGTLFTLSYDMTPEERKSYQEYLADFDPTPQYGGDDYDYPMSADAWLEKQGDNS